MYCRKCMRKQKGEGDNNKVNMEADIEEQCYICPECGNTVYWGEGEER